MEATVQTQELSTTNTPAHWPVALLNGEGKKLDASGHTVTLRATGTDTGEAFSIVEVLVPPGNTPPAPHRHSFSEAFHIIEGVLTVQLGDHVFPAPAGSFIFVPGGTVHGWRNDEELPARFLIVSSPAVIDRFYIDLDDMYSRLGNIPDTESDEIRGLWKKYGMEPVGDPLVDILQSMEEKE